MLNINFVFVSHLHIKYQYSAYSKFVTELHTHIFHCNTWHICLNILFSVVITVVKLFKHFRPRPVCMRIIQQML